MALRLATGSNYYVAGDKPPFSISLAIPFAIFITDVFLHTGQNTGRFFATVSGRIFVLVLLLHIGQYTQPFFTMFLPFLFIPTPILAYYKKIIVPTFFKGGRTFPTANVLHHIT